MNKSRKFAALIIITVILLAFPCITHAQEVDDGEPHGLYLEPVRVFYGGLVVGTNFAQVDGDYFAGYHKIGFNAGGIVYAQLAKHVALSMEILYSQKGSKSNNPEPSLTLSNVYIVKYGIAANYAEIPIMINYFDKRKSHFGVGVSYSRLVNSSETLNVDSANILKSIDLNNRYPFNKNDFNFLAGVDLHLWKGLFLNIRFQYSITPIRTELPPDYARADQYNNLWVMRVMYLLK
jgi:hypothetical protein